MGHRSCFLVFIVTPDPNHSILTSLRRSRTAFTLVEVVIALSILGVMSSGCFIGFNSLNAYASSSRLYSEAQTSAQNQIDLILSREPFDVDIAPKKIPVELMTPAELAALSPALATSPPPTSNVYYPYYLDGNGLLAKQAFIYSDPTKLDASGNPTAVVTGTLTSTITDLQDSMVLDGITSNLNSRRAVVKVTYIFHNTNYVVAMDTIRTADR